MSILAAAAAACGPQLPDPVPVSDPGALESRLRDLGTPDKPKLIVFEWRYRGRDGRFSGEGGVRVNPPDSVRLDLLGPGWSGVQSSVLIGSDVYYVGEQRITLPPPTFMWTMIGAFRPPYGVEPEGARRGERSVLTYTLSRETAVAFHFDGEGRVIEAELRIDGDVVQEIRVEPGVGGEDPDGYRWPIEARFRDLRDFHEVSIKVVEIHEHEPFEERIFDVAAR
ncbi:MAG: hypothetical protein PVJ64_08655 [Gemmatimonadales bacterium]